MSAAVENSLIFFNGGLSLGVGDLGYYGNGIGVRAELGRVPEGLLIGGRGGRKSHSLRHLNPYAVDAAYVCCGHVYIYRFGTTYSTRDKSYVRRRPFPCIALNFGFNVQMGSHHRFMFRSLSSTHRPRPMLRMPR